MSFAAFCVVWLGFLIGQAEGCIQQWTWLWIIRLLGHSGRTSSKAGKVFHGLDSGWSKPQAPWQNRVTVLALKPISSACYTLCSNTAELHTWLPGVLGSLSGQTASGAIFRSGLGYDSAPLPGWGQTMFKGQQVFAWGPKSKRLAPHPIPWSGCTTDLVLKKSKASAWDC